MAYRVCQRCVMDTSDPEITFDSNGVCNHCRRFDDVIFPYWRGFSKEWLEKKVAHIKEECKGNAYDCVLGVSGGG